MKLVRSKLTSVRLEQRAGSGLPLRKGRAAAMTYDYKRNGTTTLFAALNVLNAKVIPNASNVITISSG